MNAKMSELRQAFEAAGFVEVKTVLGTGNVVFSAKRAPLAALAKRCEAAMKRELGSSFFTIVREQGALQALLAQNPLSSFRLEPGTNRVITFLATPPRPKPKLPLVRRDARVLAIRGDAVFSVYVPGPQGPVFMALLERTFGKQITTRTWETVTKCLR
jgi:uncharacterized protein (DUF1697 family)